MPRRRRDPAPEEVTEVLAEANADIPAPTPARKRQARRTTSQISEAAQQEIHAVVSMAVSVIGLMLPATHRMLPEEIDAIFLPLERILMRRAGLKGVSPDWRDTVLCLLGVLMYAQRTGIVNRARFGRKRRGAGYVAGGANGSAGGSGAGQPQGAHLDGDRNVGSTPSAESGPGNPGQLRTVENALDNLWKSSYVPDGRSSDDSDNDYFGFSQ